jgi:hypothetical protein
VTLPAFTPPIWMMALVLAALAPWGARALQAWLERRLRQRTLDVLSRARPDEPPGRTDPPTGEGTGGKL